MRNRKSAEQPKAKHEPTLADLYTLMVSMDKRLTSLEQDMKLGVSEIENSLDEAYKTIADQENSIKILQSHIQVPKKRQEKSARNIRNTYSPFISYRYSENAIFECTSSAEKSVWRQIAE